MVTAPEAAALLAMASSFDNREQNSHATRAWAEALKDIDFTDARQVIIDHYRSDHRWIMPSDVIAGVKALEAERIAAAPNLEELEPPEWLQLMEDGPEFTAAYLEWRKENARRVRRGLPLDVGPSPVLSSRQWHHRQLVG